MEMTVTLVRGTRTREDFQLSPWRQILFEQWNALTESWILGNPNSWTLYGGKYYSAPYSLQAGTWTGAPVQSKIWVNPAVSGNLKDGRIETYEWLASSDYHAPNFYFREQEFDPADPPLNCFELSQPSIGRLYLVSYVNGVSTLRVNTVIPNPFPRDTWFKIILSWWSWVDIGGATRLRVTHEHVVGENTYQDFSVDIANPPFQDSDHNYAGMAAARIYPYLIDDTTVYRPV